MNTLKHRLHTLWILLKMFPYIISAYLFNLFQNKELWLFCERGFDAGDNAFVLFNYCKKNNISAKCFYLTTDKKLLKDKDFIKYKSFKHRFFLILTTKFFITHAKSFVDPWNIQLPKVCKNLFSTQTYIFLQHGITHNNVSNILGNKSANFDYFICGGKPEYNYISKTFGYEKEQILYTGFPRFDNLHKFNTKKEILLIPTWRSYCMQPSWIKKIIITDQQFLQSEFYKKYTELLNNKKLLKFLKKENLTFNVLMHPEAQKYTNFFNKTSKQIIFLDPGKINMQEKLKSACLLITDYSSVAFDFAYMRKPILYYQFDKNTFFRDHYKKGYFDYEIDGFGTVCAQTDHLVDEILKITNSNFKPSKKNLKKMKSFFPIYDKKNCHRIINYFN